MKYYIGVTDTKWFNFLSNRQPEDVNFWQPGGNQRFSVIPPGAPFLFKLKSPINKIAGIGFFSSHSFLPLSLAWDTFHNRNGCDNFEEFRRTISSYRKDWFDTNPRIGCIILTNPLFFREEDWISPPENWAGSIVQGKSYDTSDSIGQRLWEKIELCLDKYFVPDPLDAGKNQLSLNNSFLPAYKLLLTKVRLGQGAFRILITDAYERKCSITGEKTLPVLEAAHIKPYSVSGPHFISNGLLLRSDIHKLFDSGYITITPEYKIEVSRRIKEEFQNGKEYYHFHGSSLSFLPSSISNQPEKRFIEWHNENKFNG